MDAHWSAGGRQLRSVAAGCCACAGAGTHALTCSALPAAFALRHPGHPSLGPFAGARRTKLKPLNTYGQLWRGVTGSGGYHLAYCGLGLMGGNQLLGGCGDPSTPFTPCQVLLRRAHTRTSQVTCEHTDSYCYLQRPRLCLIESFAIFGRRTFRSRSGHVWVFFGRDNLHQAIGGIHYLPSKWSRASRVASG